MGLIEYVSTIVQISALQHYMYCPRQCALIHVECLWSDNQATALGNVFHERADSGTATCRGNTKTVRSLHIQSNRMGISGIADVVEFLRNAPDGSLRSVTPIEYKVGRPKKHSSDEVQLCAQALCLEETFGVPIDKGYLFYGKTRRQHVVILDGELRALTRAVILETRTLLDSGKTPPARYSSTCRLCSLYDLCMPRTGVNDGKRKTVARLFEDALADNGEDLI